MDELAKCYQVMGIKPGCSEADLEAAYQERSEAWQPENFSHDEKLLAKARERLGHIQDAYSRIRKEIASEVAPAAVPDAPILAPEWPRRDPRVDAFPAEQPVSAARKAAVWFAWIILILLLTASAWFAFFKTDRDSVTLPVPPSVPDPSTTNSLTATNNPSETNAAKPD